MAGTLTPADLFAALGEFGKDYPVGAAMPHTFPTKDQTETLETALERLEVYEEQAGDVWWAC